MTSVFSIADKIHVLLFLSTVKIIILFEVIYEKTQLQMSNGLVKSVKTSDAISVLLQESSEYVNKSNLHIFVFHYGLFSRKHLCPTVDRFPVAHICSSLYIYICSS